MHTLHTPSLSRRIHTHKVTQPGRAHLLIIKYIKAKLPVRSETAPSITYHRSGNNTKLNIPHFSLSIHISVTRGPNICEYTGANRPGPSRPPPPPPRVERLTCRSSCGGRGSSVGSAGRPQPSRGRRATVLYPQSSEKVNLECVSVNGSAPKKSVCGKEAGVSLR